MLTRIFNIDSERKQTMTGLAVFILMAFMAFYPALKGGFIWDDDRYVENNDNLKSIEGLRDIWLKPFSIPQWYPLTHTTFWVEYQLWGLNPFGYHFNNILLHALSSFLLWVILRRLKIPGASIAAAIFAIHPVHTESVAWITERKNILSGFFALFSLYFYLRFSARIRASKQHPMAKPQNQPKKIADLNYILSFLFFICALLSKTVVASLPAVVLVLIWWQNGSIKRRDLQFLIPFFIFGIGLGLFTAWTESFFVGAEGEEFNFGFIERCLIAGRALWFYLYKIVLPLELIFIYPRWEIDIEIWWQYLFPISFILLLSGLFYFRTRIGRGPIAALLIFTGVLFPAIGFLNVFPHRFSFVADHFQYHASISIITVLSAGISIIASRYFSSSRQKTIFHIIIALMLFNLGLKTIISSFTYRDTITLWTDTILRNRECWIAYNNLGSAYLKQKQFDKALPVALEAIRVKPDYDIAYVTLADAYFYLSNYDRALAKYDQAITLFKNKKETNPYSKWQYMRLGPKCYTNMGYIYRIKKDYQRSLENLFKAVQMNHNITYTYKLIGETFSLMGHFDEAIENYLKALPEMENDPVLQNNLGMALLKVGKNEEAIIHFKLALEIMPSSIEVRKNLSLAENRLSGNN